MVFAELRSRSEVAVDAWDRFVSSHPDGWWFHTWTWLDYAAAYSPTAIDMSQVYVSGCEIVAVVPLIFEPDGTPVFGGQLTPAPLSLPDVTICSTINKRIQWAYRPGREIEDLPVDYVERKHGTYVVDLSKPEEELWRGLRKSYKSLIHRAEERYNVRVSSHLSIDESRKAMEIAQELHFCSAGRKTRPQRTWDLQANWLASGDGVLLVASRDHDLVGFAYIIRWKDWAYYASGASLEDNVSHLLIWKAMNLLAADEQTRYFEIGHADEDGDAKARSIAFFKSGFGGEKWIYRTAIHKEFA